MFFFIFKDLYRIFLPFFDYTYRNTTTDENTLDSTNRGNLESSNSNPASETNKKTQIDFFFPKMELTHFFPPELKIYK